MNIHQVAVTYQAEQDRLLVRINTAAGEELRLWFTRRLMLGLWPLINRFLDDQLVRSAPGIPAAAAADTQTRHMVAEFQKEALMRQADFATPFQEPEKPPALGAQPLLVTDVNLTPSDQGRLRLEFIEKSPGDGKPLRSAAVALDARLQQAFVHLLTQSLAHAKWALPVPAAAPEAPPEMAPPTPRYLN